MTQEAVDKKNEEKLSNGTDKSVKPDEKGKERRDATPTKVCPCLDISILQTTLISPVSQRNTKQKASVMAS